MNDTVGGDDCLGIFSEQRGAQIRQNVEDGKGQPDDAMSQRNWGQKFVGFALTQVTRILLLAQIFVDECVNEKNNE